MNNFEQFLEKNEKAILEGWFDAILGTYPPETARIWKKEKNRFANPVGNTIYEGMVGIYRELSKGHEIDPEKVAPFLDRIIRVRAVQDFSASKAVAVIFMLKGVIREKAEGEARENPISAKELLAMDSRVDDLGLISFDIYMGCKEQIYELRVNEVKNRTARLLQRANLIAEGSSV